MAVRRRCGWVLGVLAVATAAVAAACGGGGPRHAADPARAPGPAPAPACGPGTFGGRYYVLCTAGARRDEPLVIALHGRGETAADMQATTQLERPAAAAGLAVAYLDGPGDRWGDDTFPTPDRPAGDEDVRYLDDLVAHLQADPRIGDGRVAVVGFSNGASMALRYAGARPGQVRAVVAVAGQLPRDPAVSPRSADRPPRVLVVDGTADPIRPFATGVPDPGPGLRTAEGPTPSLSTPETMAQLAAAFGRDNAVLRTVAGGGHTWPDARVPPPARFGPVSHEFDASALAIDFVLGREPADLRTR